MNARTLLLVAGTALITGACSTFSPPPMMLLHEPVQRSAPGGGSVGVAGGPGAGVFLDDVAGGEALVSVQATRETSVEASGGAGARLGNRSESAVGVPSVLGFGRVGFRHRVPSAPWLSLRAGLGGGGSDTGLVYTTADVGLSVGHTFANRVRPYAGLSVAASVPLLRGPDVYENASMEPDDLHRITSTFWLAGSLGVSVRLIERLELGVEAQAYPGVTADGDTVFAVSATGSLRMAFGPSR